MHVDGNATFRKRWHRDNQIFRFRVFLIHKSKLTSAVIDAFLISFGVVKTENIGKHWMRFRVVLPFSNSSSEVRTEHNSHCKDFFSLKTKYLLLSKTSFL